jgi:hypothetical protein
LTSFILFLSLTNFSLMRFTKLWPLFLTEASVENSDLDRGVSVVEYAVAMSSGQGLELAQRLAALPQLTSNQRDMLNKILANQPQWSPI